MTKNPQVSVILATYHRPQVLRCAIETVLWQTLPDFELLVVGDACADGTEAAVRSFGDPRIQWHNLDANTGNQAGPNNAGLARARGRYVAYMHQDDLWLPGHLAKLVAALEAAPDMPAAHTLCLQISPVAEDSPERIRVVAGLPNTAARYGPEGRVIYAPALMHRTAAGRAIGGWRDWLTIHETPVFDFIQRLAGAEWRIVTVPDATVVKFHSAQRRGSYRTPSCEEQAEYLRRIRTEPDFLEKELVLALDAVMRNKRPIRRAIRRGANLEPGWEIRAYQRVRFDTAEAIADADAAVRRDADAARRAAG
jgi:glycosyltransferase involved in cell wall biosynthesis